VGVGLARALALTTGLVACVVEEPGLPPRADGAGGDAAGLRGDGGVGPRPPAEGDGHAVASGGWGGDRADLARVRDGFHELAALAVAVPAAPRPAGVNEKSPAPRRGPGSWDRPPGALNEASLFGKGVFSPLGWTYNFERPLLARIVSIVGHGWRPRASAACACAAYTSSASEPWRIVVAAGEPQGGAPRLTASVRPAVRSGRLGPARHRPPRLDGHRAKRAGQVCPPGFDRC
jgi:hypothetical protein